MFKKNLIIVSLLAAALLWPSVSNASVRAATPVRLQIPQLKIDAVVDPRGLNSRGLMLPPSSPTRVAWDKTGVVPGNPGEAVIYGHLTDNHFRPAIFYRLNYLNTGSRVKVTDAKGTIHTFKVVRKKAIRADRITYFDVAGDSKYIHLNLYTCAGRWDQLAHHYTHFLVVYTVLVSSVPRR